MQGRFQFVCIAETDDICDPQTQVIDCQGSMRGQVFIIWNRELWRKNMKDEVFDAFQTLNDYEQFPANISLKSYFASTYQKLKIKASQNCAFQCEFMVLRNGVISFFADDQSELAPESPPYPSGIRQHAVISQVYSFMRDIAHVHQHHSPSSDTIVDVYSADNDDVTWRKNTLFSIYRRVISFKRQRDIAVQIRSIGLMAYAEAFQKAWHGDRPHQANKEIPPFHNTEMKESIRSSELRMRYKLQQETERTTAFRTVTFSLLALILSFAGLVKLSGWTSTVQPSPVLTWTTDLLLTKPLQSVFAVGIVVLFFTLSLTSNFKPYQHGSFRYFQALMQPYRRLTALVFCFLFASALTYAALRLLW
jgi:hypothetical protein